MDGAMVERQYCDLCGSEARGGLTKEFAGEVKRFCSPSCLKVYQLMWTEGLIPEEAEGKYFNGEDVQNPKENKRRKVWNM